MDIVKVSGNNIAHAVQTIAPAVHVQTQRFALLLPDSLQHSVGPEQSMCVMLLGDHLCQQVHSI